VMPEFVLKNSRALDFFKKHTHLDFNEMCGIFVDIMEKLVQNMSDTMENSHNTALLKTLATRMEHMETSFQQHNTTMSDSLKHQSEQFSVMINQHLENMLSHMRDTLKSNHGDAEKNIMDRIQSNNDLFLSKLGDMGKHEGIRSFLEAELEKMNQRLRDESERVLNTVEKSNIGAELSTLIAGQYKELDATFKARVDSFFSSQSSSNGSMYSEIMSRLEKTSSAVDTVGDYFQRQIGSTNKGKQGEAKLEVLLADLYPSAEIRNTAGMTACGDFIVTRTGKSKVLIDTKDYDTVVPIKEVDKLIRDVEQNNCHGVLISQHSGIAQKEDFEINVHNQKIIVFLHNAKYEASRVKMAFDIIDHLEPYLVSSEIIQGEAEEMISSEVLLAINKEYQELVTQKLNLIQNIRKTQGDLIVQVQKMDLPELTKYLDKKFANTGKTGLLCDICGVYMGKNPRSLAAHRRRCVPATATIGGENEVVSPVDIKTED
jgi:hypothetical protein